VIEKYKKLDKALNKNKDDEVEELFKEILEEAINVINEKFKNDKKLDVNDPYEKAVIRAMFEYMIELWAEGTTDEAKMLGYDMLYLVADEKLQEMFSMFVIGMLAGLNEDEFFKKYVKDRVYKDYFFVDFDDKIDNLVKKYENKFQEEYSKDEW